MKDIDTQTLILVLLLFLYLLTNALQIAQYAGLKERVVVIETKINK